MTASPHLIQSNSVWPDVAKDLDGVDRLAVDMEADGFHRYPERVSLIQIGLPDGRIWLVDPLFVDDLSLLGHALADPSVETVLHSADYDLRSLDRDFGFRVHGLFDTSIAAQFCGSARTGLVNVLDEYLGIRISKSKRMQRHDWSRRPLSEAAISYAASDVLHLFALADELHGRLADLGRTAWVAEECKRMQGVRYRQPAPPCDAFLSISGARSLSDEQRSILRELCVFRESEARRIGRPPYRLLSDKALLALSEQPDTRVQALNGVNRGWLSEAHEDLQAAVRRGYEADPIPWPRRGRGVEWSSAARDRLRKLKRWRTREAERLELDPGIVWPADHLKRLSLHADADARQADVGNPPWVRKWQWSELGKSLEMYRKTAPGPA